MKRRSVTGAAMVAVGVIAAGGGVWASRRATADDAASGPLWSAKFDTPGGPPLSMSQFRGHPLVLNFWATWCAPCVKEMPQLDRFHRDFAGQGWQVVGLAVDNLAAVKTFLTKVAVGFPIGLAGLDGADLGRTLGNVQGGLPFTAVFNANGRQVHTKSGETSYDELAAWARQSA